MRLLNLLVNIFAFWPYVGLLNLKRFFDPDAALNNDAKEVEWLITLLNDDLIRQILSKGAAFVTSSCKEFDLVSSKMSEQFESEQLAFDVIILDVNLLQECRDEC